MSKCPLCHTPVKDDFGLIECPGCQAQLIVHMDGQVEYKGEEALREEAPVEAAETPRGEEAFTGFEPMRELDLDAPELNVDPEQAQAKTVVRRTTAEDLVPPGTQARMPEDDPLEPEKEFLGAAFPDDAVMPEEPAPVEPTVALDSPMFADEDNQQEFAEEIVEEQPPPVEAAEENPEAVAEEPAPAASEDLFPDFMSDSPAPPQESVYNSAPPSSPNLSDVAAFGNSDLSGGREGPLRYTLFIEGIDTIDVREAFREAITDRKLMWDTDQILRSVRNGKVNIQNVAPTKAYILITRLRGMPVQVRWEQYAISQT